MKRHLAAAIVASLVLAGPTARAADLADLIPNLFGPDGIRLAPPPPPNFSHEAHFIVESQAQLLTFNNALKGQLGNFPLPSPSGGFTFTFDPSLGTFSRSTESFGPLFAERAETIGRRRFSAGFSYSRFTYNQLDGKELDNGELTLTFLHEPTGDILGRPPFFFEGDTVTARLFTDITTDLFVLSANYGILDNLDVAMALPIVRQELDVRAEAQVNRTATGPSSNIHTFANGSTTQTFRASDEATGLGDLLLRAKYNFLRTERFGMTAQLALRLPTGDEDELLGIGSPRVLPIVIASGRVLGIAPHVNVGFDLGDTSDLENEFVYAVGFDWAPWPWFTFAFDVLGRHVIDNQRPKAGGAGGSTGTSNDDIVNVAIGFKANPWRNVLLFFNALIPLNDTGLRDDFTPLFGVEVTF
jgi:hypothetical protein